MGTGATLGDFLRNRRGRLRPADVGLPAGVGRRQTPGLRREELAALAGVSVDYYVRLEQGRDTHPGTGVLDALASALRLDGDERAHLYRLARGGPYRGDAPGAGALRPGLLRMLDLVRPAPAYILDPTPARPVPPQPPSSPTCARTAPSSHGCGGTTTYGSTSAADGGSTIRRRARSTSRPRS